MFKLELIPRPPTCSKWQRNPNYCDSQTVSMRNVGRPQDFAAKNSKQNHCNDAVSPQGPQTHNESPQRQNIRICNGPVYHEFDREIEELRCGSGKIWTRKGKTLFFTNFSYFLPISIVREIFYRDTTGTQREKTRICIGKTEKKNQRNEFVKMTFRIQKATKKQQIDII